MIRRFRRRLLSTLPVSARARLQLAYDRVAAPMVGIRAHVTIDAGAAVLTIAGGPVIRFPSECRAEVERSFSTRESAAEVERFMRRSGRGLLFDVGANSGLFSLLFCMLDSSNRAVAYEPSPRMAAAVHDAAVLNGVDTRLQVVGKAVADSVGELDLLLDTRGGYVQTAQFAGTSHDAWRPTRFSTTTLDAEVGVSGVPSVVKIDVEGHEYEVLLGALEMMTTVRPLIFLEIHLNYLEQRRIPVARVLDVLNAGNYRLVDLFGRERSINDIARSWARVIHVIATPAEGDGASPGATP